MSENVPVSQEIIIVRRNNGDGDGGHHGGAWKIAYADFVTAMMAFFLVMWLVNSANEVTKSRVASYFNPIKMTDASANSRGLKSTSEKKTTEQKEEDGAATEKKTKQDEQEAEKAMTEDKLLKSPFAAMDEIVSEASSKFGVRRDGSESSSVGDPFDPKAWEALRNGKLAEEVSPNTSGRKEEGNTPNSQDDVELRPTTEMKNDELAKNPESDKGTTAPVAGPSVSAQGKLDEETLVLEGTIEGLIDKHKSELDITAEVRRTEEGLLIKLGDNSGKGMFAIGSAEPSAGLIEIVGVIGKLLSQQSGSVVVRGHTDGRKYKAGRRDNWQLSTARAHMASYMLMRGGLDESRISSIEGHGAATPLLTSDPNADANRRVEFLLQTGVKRGE